MERSPLPVGGGNQTAVFVVDDDTGFASLACDFLARAGFGVRSFASGELALDAAREEAPSVVILDVHLPGVSGYEVCQELRRQYGERIGIIFVSGERREPFDRIGGLMLGADDYLVKPFEPGELVARVRGLMRRVGVEALSAEPEHAPNGFTKREEEVLSMLANGLRQNDIAVRLVISPKTVATHIQRILAKLGVHSRAEAVALAHQRNLVPLDGADDTADPLASAV